jgi:hypothetical protein
VVSAAGFFINSFIPGHNNLIYGNSSISEPGCTAFVSHKPFSDYNIFTKVIRETSVRLQREDKEINY